MRKISVLIWILTLGISNAFTQGIEVRPLKSNNAIKAYQNQNPNSLWLNREIALGITDTLSLPFFEDFTGTKVYPDFGRFIDNYVYVNDHFPISPPSYGVATFDNLDENGLPYETLNEKNSSISDFLTSQPINLKDYVIGANTQNYKLSDSIFLSFLYQKGGNGDMPENIDSLILQFKDSTDTTWHTVWSVEGGGSTSFKEAIVGVNNTIFLHDNFQFRIYNYSKNTGNLNHWNVDYIRMAQGRNSKDTLVEEIALNKRPHALLKNYYEMPYDHFKLDYSNEVTPDFNLTVRNNEISTTKVAMQYEAFNRYGTRIGFSPFTSNNRNIDPFSDSTETFTMFRIDTLSGDNPYVRLKLSINPEANDFTSGNYNATTNNNTIEAVQEFPNYFAYDDGTAEAGMGLEYGGLPSGEGFVACKFKANKKDTIWGVNIHLTQVLKDVSSIPFSIVVWKKLTSTSQSHNRDDEILYEQEVTYVKQDTVNGLYSIYFDTAQAIDAGEFYVGWRQNSKYYFNVGYDKNYQYQHKDQVNPNIVYNLLGYWRNANIKGAIMLRPMVGAFEQLPVSIEEPIKLKKAIVYPNPTNGTVNIKLPFGEIGKVEVFSSLGRLVHEGNTSFLELSHLPRGQYYLKIWDHSGEHFYSNSLIKTN